MKHRCATIAMVILLATGCATTTPAPPFSGKKTKECHADIHFVGGKQCALVLPTTIYTDEKKNKDKCKMVKWWVDETLEYSWTMKHKAATGDNLLGGPYTIAVGDNHAESDKAKKKDGDWYYDVIVKNDKGVEVCKVDPLIVIKR